MSNRNMTTAPLILLVISLSACLEEASTENGAQAAEVTPQATNTTALKDVSTLRCLDSNTSGNAYTLGCNGGNFQYWITQSLDFGTELRDRATSRCLDSDTSGKLYTMPCNGGSFQQWILTSHTISGGGTAWELKNAATRRCLDSDTAGHAYTSGCNGGNFQHWIFQ